MDAGGSGEFCLGSGGLQEVKRKLHAPKFSASLIIVNSDAPIASVSALLKNHKVLKIEEIYRARLGQLIKKAGSQVALSRLIEKSPAQISQWMSASKDSRTGKPRAMDRATARFIEKKMGLADGWMDQSTDPAEGLPNESPKHQASGGAWPFTTVTIERFEALGYEQKVIVEDALVQAIERMEQRAASKGNANAVRIDSTPQPKRGNGG